MGRVTIKNFSIGWREDRSFRLADDIRQELTDIANLDHSPEEAVEMLDEVQRTLSMYSTMVESIDKGPRPAHQIAVLKPMIENADALIRSLHGGHDVRWELTSEGFHFDADRRSLIAQLEKFRHAAAKTVKTLGGKESRHGTGMAARDAIIEKLKQIFDRYSEADEVILSKKSYSKEKLSAENIKMHFVKAALQMAHIPHPPLRYGKRPPSKGRLTRLVRGSRKLRSP